MWSMLIFSPGCEIMNENKKEAEVQRTQSTAGPWKLEEDGMIYGADGYMVADPHCEQEEEYGKREANAVLITAAPELRDALEELVKQMYALATDECKEWRDAEALLTRLRAVADSTPHLPTTQT